jgi:hypothetical protein
MAVDLAVQLCVRTWHSTRPHHRQVYRRWAQLMVANFWVPVTGGIGERWINDAIAELTG